MELYKLTNDLIELNTLLNDDTQEVDYGAISEIMANINIDIDEKISNIASLIKNKLAMAKAIKEEEGNLKARRERAEKQAESLKTYLSDEMQKIEKLKFEDEKHKISFRKSMN